MRYITSLALLSLFTFSNAQTSQRLSVFLDCSNTWCDMTYFRTELPIVDYSRDRVNSDVHILLTTQRAGTDSRGYQIIFYGQGSFSGLRDTITFVTNPNTTDFERRDAMLKHVKYGLVPFLIKNGQIDIIKLEYDSNGIADSTTNSVIDPWNYWVYRIGGNGNLSIDQNYQSYRLGGNLRVSRVTDEKKVFFMAWGNKNVSEYNYENDDGTEEIAIVDNYQINLEHSFIWTIGDKWAAGYEIGYNSNTFINWDNVYYVSPSIEKNLFAYSDVNNKLLTLRYGLMAGMVDYIETTIYGKNQQRLFAEYLSLTAQFNQKWGNIETRLRYLHYFHDFTFNNLSFESEIELRLTGNLSLDLYFEGAIVHDQLYLPIGDANAEEVLTRQRALASSFNLGSFIGINYRFGSKINNFVNPRFGSRGF